MDIQSMLWLLQSMAERSLGPGDIHGGKCMWQCPQQMPARQLSAQRCCQSTQGGAPARCTRPGKAAQC